MTRVAIRRTADDNVEFYSDDPSIVILCIDEMTPGDRVYRWTDPGTGDELDALIEGERIGYLNDGSPAQEIADQIARGDEPKRH